MFGIWCYLKIIKCKKKKSSVSQLPWQQKLVSEKYQSCWKDYWSQFSSRRCELRRTGFLTPMSIINILLLFHQLVSIERHNIVHVI